MARRPFSITKLTNADVARVGKDNNGLTKAAIFVVSPDGSINSDCQKGCFLLNPSSWEEDKSTNWVGHNIPGQSDPIHQWISGGARSVSFQALVIRDTADFPGNKDSGGLVDKVISVVGNLASSFFNVNVPPLGDILLGQNTVAGDDLSIADKLNYYRSLEYPTYVQGKLTNSPPLVFLAAGSSFSLEQMPDKITPKSTVWVVTNVKINIIKQLPNLSPLEATVDFRLVQYIFNSKSSSDFSGTPKQSTPQDTFSSLSSTIGGLLG